MTRTGLGSPLQARGFDRLAPIYDVMSTVLSLGRIHASQVALLPLIPPVGKMLIVGGGSGRFLAEAMRRNVAREAVSIDLSRAMTHRTAVRLAASGLNSRVDLRVGGLEKLGVDETFDLIVTHCFLDLFDEAELQDVMHALWKSLRPGGLWLFSDFAVDGKGLPNGLRRGLVKGLYLFFRAITHIGASRLPDFDAAFERAGLTAMERRSFAGGLLETRLLLKKPR